jgi:hypothetical protein
MRAEEDAIDASLSTERSHELDQVHYLAAEI